MTASLIPALPLIEGEALTGYVSRHAKLFETTPRDFCTDLGMRWPALCSGYEEQIERLAWLIGEPSQTLRSWSVRKLGMAGIEWGKPMQAWAHCGGPLFGCARNVSRAHCLKWGHMASISYWNGHSFVSIDAMSIDVPS